MIRRPPRSTLFPYPPLSRSAADFRTRVFHPEDVARLLDQRRDGLARGVPFELEQRARRRDGRSEEHTSELQSPCNLVCRLLLEKKKKTVLTHTHNHLDKPAV